MCRLCDFLATLSDEELLPATTCLQRAFESRWPGSTGAIDPKATEEEMAAALAKRVNAIPKRLHHLLYPGLRPQ